MEFGFVWLGFLFGNIQLIGLLLDEFDIVLEIDFFGVISWELCWDFVFFVLVCGEVFGDSGFLVIVFDLLVVDLQGDIFIVGFLKSIGVDFFVIISGMLIYRDVWLDIVIIIDDFVFNFEVLDFVGDVQLDFSFVFQDILLVVVGMVVNLLVLVFGEQVLVNLIILFGENKIVVFGMGGVQLLCVDLNVDVFGLFLKVFVVLVGQLLGVEFGVFVL